MEFGNQIRNSTEFHKLLFASQIYLWYISFSMEGSHSGLVRAPAKRLACENGLMGSNPIPSAAKPNS